MAAIWVVAVIAVIGELGVDVSGVILTATVIGGALAFGAQALVRDVIAGVFVLSEDQYAVGDVIDVGVIGGGTDRIIGTVERMTLRSTRLRDGDGRVWHVPNGNVLRVANLSKESSGGARSRRSTATPICGHARTEVGRLGIAPRRRTRSPGPWCVGDVAEVGCGYAMHDDRMVMRSHDRHRPRAQGRRRSGSGGSWSSARTGRAASIRPG